jgi:hypothetical protein
MQIELTQDELIAILVTLEHITDEYEDDPEFINNALGISAKDISSAGRKLFEKCDNKVGRWPWNSNE